MPLLPPYLVHRGALPWNINDVGASFISTFLMALVNGASLGPPMKHNSVAVFLASHIISILPISILFLYILLGQIRHFHFVDSSQPFFPGLLGVIPEVNWLFPGNIAKVLNPLSQENVPKSMNSFPILNSSTAE